MDAVKVMPKMLAGSELASALSILPEHDESIRNESEAVRLMALSDLYRIYLPSQMSMTNISMISVVLCSAINIQSSKQE